LVTPGQGVGTVGARIVDGEVRQAGVLGSTGSLLSVSTADQDALSTVPADGQPHTIDLPDLGAYRVLASVRPGEAGTQDIVLTGLPMDGVTATLYKVATVEAALLAIAVLGTVVGGAVIIRWTLRPLRRVAATAVRVSQLPLHRGEVSVAERVGPDDVDPRTEVGSVGASLNQLLNHVEDALSARQESEERVRQFVADASHELRTPLATIRGYTELADRGGGELPDEVRHALGRILSETGRMSALVDDLLLLARLDSGRALRADPVDLAPLVVDAVRDAHAVSPERRWQLDFAGEEVVVLGDEPRLQQVLANLLANARIHTPPGTTVAVGLQRKDGRAVLTVADDGPGIPAEWQGRIFERFVRRDESRSRKSGSSGLGLAIVSAVLASHRGTIAVRSAPGRTVFEISLPALTANS
jgi:two-component system OmpR family sensor kinase